MSWCVYHDRVHRQINDSGRRIAPYRSDLRAGKLRVVLCSKPGGMTMIQSILIVFDGQPASHASVSLALRWAAERNALLAALGVIDEALVHPAEAVPLGAGQAKREWDAARLHRQRQSIEKTLSAAAELCATNQVSFKPLERYGFPADEIAVEAQRFDLIVMPKYVAAPEGVSERDLNAALLAMLHTAPRPVIAVPDEPAETGVNKNVVIAYDGSLQATRALQLFTALGLPSDRALYVVSVGDDSLSAARHGDRAVDFLSHHGIRADLRVIEKTLHPAEHIVACAQELDAEFIVMGAYGQSRIREFALGSVTKSVLAESAIPLFLYH